MTTTTNNTATVNNVLAILDSCEELHSDIVNRGTVYDNVDLLDIIRSDSATAEDVQTFAKVICISVLRYFRKASYSEKIDNCYNAVISGAEDCNGYHDASDIQQECILAIYEMIADGSILEEDAIKVLFRKISAYVRGTRAVVANTKTVFVEDVNAVYEEYVRLNKAQVGYIQTDNATTGDINHVEEIITALCLTDRQRTVLNLRLRGYSLSQIADKMRISENCVCKHINAIQKKARDCSMIDTTETHIKKCVNNDTKAKSFEVFRNEKNHAYVGMFHSIGDCCRKLSIDKSSVIKCLKGYRPSHKGYTFRYCDISVSELMRADRKPKHSRMKHLPSEYGNENAMKRI